MQNSDAMLADAIKSQSVTSDATLEATTVRLPPDVLEYLRTTAEKRGVSTGDMLRIALGTQKFLAEAVSNGAKVQLNLKGSMTDVAI
ncbi:hypothetical protein [uncultured Sphingomonas sp.]|uniref:hypothetical protein n=1 Tax=uncultured Sphingomonas sp. TaxID=158754 RepID=UPI0035CBB3B9